MHCPRFLLSASLLVLVSLAVSDCGGRSPTSPSGGTGPVSLPTLEEMRSEKVLGSESAPNTVIEYSALTCSHCADFHAVSFPEMKRKHIDTGNVRFVFRDFPLDPTPSPGNAGLSGAMVARCAGNARYLDALVLLYRTQGSWGSDPARQLRSVMSGMMSQATVDACLALADLRNAVLQARASGQSEFGITGTPTFIVNGHKVVGDLGLGALEAYFR